MTFHARVCIAPSLLLENGQHFTIQCDNNKCIAAYGQIMIYVIDNNICMADGDNSFIYCMCVYGFRQQQLIGCTVYVYGYIVVM